MRATSRCGHHHAARRRRRRAARAAASREQRIVVDVVAVGAECAAVVEGWASVGVLLIVQSAVPIGCVMGLGVPINKALQAHILNLTRARYKLREEALKLKDQAKEASEAAGSMRRDPLLDPLSDYTWAGRDTGRAFVGGNGGEGGGDEMETKGGETRAGGVGGGGTGSAGSAAQTILRRRHRVIHTIEMVDSLRRVLQHGSDDTVRFLGIPVTTKFLNSVLLIVTTLVGAVVFTLVQAELSQS